MTAHTQDPGAQQSAEQRRRKRRERAAKSRTPEPKNIVSGAGQPSTRASAGSWRTSSATI